jgi:hypothetical protein
VVARESNDGDVLIAHKGVALPARKFIKDARVSQAAIADNKLLGPILAEIQKRQRNPTIRRLQQNGRPFVTRI